MSELKACVECGAEVPKSEMFGAPGDKRCQACAQAFGARMDPTRSHSVAQASTGTRKARQRKQSLILGGLLLVGVVIAWLLPDRSAQRLERVAVEREPPTPEDYLARWEIPPEGLPGAAVDVAELSEVLPATLSGWRLSINLSSPELEDDQGKALRGGFALVVFQAGSESLSARVMDRGRVRTSDLETFRRAANTSWLGAPGVARRRTLREARFLVGDRVWVDVRGPGRSDIGAMLDAIDRAALERLAERKR